MKSFKRLSLQMPEKIILLVLNLKIKTNFYPFHCILIDCYSCDDRLYSSWWVICEGTHLKFNCGTRATDKLKMLLVIKLMNTFTYQITSTTEEFKMFKFRFVWELQILCRCKYHRMGWSNFSSAGHGPKNALNLLLRATHF